MIDARHELLSPTAARSSRRATSKSRRRTVPTLARPSEPCPGTCRVCGCTDDRACIAGGAATYFTCHWIDDEHTLCSSCNTQRSAA